MARDSKLIGWRAAAALQGSLAAAVFVMIVFAPPEVGRTLLVPLDGRPIGEAVLERSALARLAPGPLPGSILVEGRGRVLAANLFEQGIVMLAAPAAICGGISTREAKRDG